MSLLRLFGFLGVLVILSAGLALSTDALFFRIATPVLAIPLFALYFWLQRSLPSRRGALRVAGLREPVEVYRDERGVPHIYARSLHDLYMAQGYITAQDRLWSMDLSRRAASGRMAELFGPNLVALDKFFRTVGIRRAAEASLAVYSPRVREYLDAYAAGVNACIAEGKLSPEFNLLRYRPEPWTAADSLAIVKYSAFEFGGNWSAELFRTKLVRTVGAEKAAELFWLPPDIEALSELEDLALPDLDALLDVAAACVAEAVGSSGWVVAGSRSESGAPLLATAPCLPLRNPALWYQTHLVGPEQAMDVSGAAFPGVPGIINGQNREIAWGAQHLHADVQDLFVEQAHPELTDHFAFQGRWEKAATFQETIAVHGAEPVDLTVTVTRHGPVLTRGAQTALALKWTALGPSTELETLLDLNAARSWTEFRRVTERHVGPAYEFLFAGRDGTIGARVAGQVPVRAKGDGQAPVPGWNGEYEWTGYIPFAGLPETVNPAEGFIVSAGQEMTPEDCPYHLGSNWAPPYQARRITERLWGASALTPEKVQEVQMDCVNLQARRILPLLLQAVQEGLHQGQQVETLTPLEKNALLIMSGWEHEEIGSLPAPAIWHQWYLFLVEGIFRPQMGLQLFDQFLISGMPVQVADRLIQEVAEGGGSLWLPREGEDGLPRLALRSFKRAVALLGAKQGSRPEGWRWDREHRIAFSHRLTLKFPALRHILNLGSYPVCGSGMAIRSNAYSQVAPFAVVAAPSWRQVVDLGSPGEAREICAPGQSDNPLSPHHADQFMLWLKGETSPRLVRHETIRALPRLLLHPGVAPAEQQSR